MNKELEFAAGNYADDTFGFSNESHFYWKDSQRHFIAGATSKWVEKQKLEFAVEQYEIIKKNEYCPFPLFTFCNEKIKELEQKLSKI